jgi:hypothetical protein
LRFETTANEGNMTLRLTQLHFAAMALAIAAVALSGPSARAFTQENLNATNADGSSRFADPDDQVKNFGQGAHLFGENGPTLQFGTQSGPMTPFNRWGPGFNSGPTPPDPYARPLGNGN